MSADRELVLTRLINAPREKVYRAWTDSEILKKWFAPLPYTTPVADTPFFLRVQVADENTRPSH